MPNAESTVAPALFPVTHSVISPSALLDEISRAYPIATSSSCRLLEFGLNDSYELRADGVSHVVRVYRAGWRSAADVAYELELLLHLAEHGVPVSIPIADRDGLVTRRLAVPEGMRLMAVFSYAPGAAFHWRTGEDSARAGRLLGAIHAASDDFTGNRERFELDLDELVERPLALLRPFLDARGGDWAYVEGLAARLRGRIETLARAGLDWGPCHGDFGANNLHVDEREGLTVFDFDFCGNGWRAYDLVVPHWSARRRRSDDMWESFLRGYSEKRELQAADLAALPLFDAIRHLWGMGLRVRNIAYRGSHEFGESYIAYRLASFRRWEARHGGLL